ncbi:unnamed protein product [Didymodactylos carnosus]|uniref:Delta-aminolevulinic acid dehydratase n=1 Tax=Didymodactylos carnosus TaxID=1234261 RepID=A0A814A3F6_9BILA|nr:unnamed protein product [Didymodactylos carnosus]CAF1199684.1 unnamed protein product [Didymodactylos carnosus]CAF3688424.1 unnamed protein product [Didymodactylos carnosus]CAF4009835.1 unnamed protein product [Didymodactylos carnosus]
MEPDHLLHSGYFNETIRSWQGTHSHLDVRYLIYPVFVTDLVSFDDAEEIPNFPNQFRFGPNKLIEHLSPLVSKGLSTILLFGVIKSENKTPDGQYALSPQSPVRQVLPLLRKEFPSLTIACDLCLCSYTSHGHCGLLNEAGHIDNELTIKRLSELALSYVYVGADIIAPSDMMDGRISEIKRSLIDVKLASRCAVMSYCSKFASCFYGPFRDAAQSTPSFGDRRSYQLPVYSAGLAIRAAERDVKEGADILMVKPAQPFLDIVKDLKQYYPNHPLAVYQVSGEYAMLYHAAKAGAFDLKTAVIETLTGMRRAGADIIITYFTPQLLDWLQK